MSSLFNKQIVVGVTGGIAAYKSAELVRRLQDRGATVRVIMTAAAQEFVTPLTFQALSGNPVHTQLLDTAAEAAMGHIELARWADLIVVAPASADFIARLCHGEGGDLLSTVCLAAHSPVAIAPAMNQAMWHKASTQDNLNILLQRGVLQFGPAEGEQACGDVGLGRMVEVADIVAAAEGVFATGRLAGKKVVITAGPTREAIDPVRYLSNHSSGKMGYALAQAAIDAGAITILISGPTALPPPPRAQTIAVISAAEMFEQSLKQGRDCDVFIAAAAVADFRPVKIVQEKIKKGDADTLSLELVKNPDIVATVAGLNPKPYTVGFSAETEQLETFARDKLQRKNLDLIVANDVSQADIGFNSDNNAVTLIFPDGEQRLSKRSKQQLARDLIGFIADQTTAPG
jgi:phosphopantothenoylcysteine decarboxylase/phosphopantothenate--cysteine ligase